MIIQSIRIKEGLHERIIDFSSSVNLIYSEKNGKGKTTLLRFLLYSLGYSIPNTRKIRFERCEVETKLRCDSCGEISLLRFSNDFIVAHFADKKLTYILPDQINELHEVVFGTNNTDILENILGAIYIDQEKGWTLLNRGIVIGSIHFSIEALIRGLSGRNCAALLAQEAKLESDLGKYRQMFSIAKYQEDIAEELGTLAVEDFHDVSEAEMNQLFMKKKQLKSELSRIDHALSDNKRFRQFVTQIRLLIKAPSGEIIPVTEDNIVGLADTIDFLIAKRKMIASELCTISLQIDHLSRTKDSEESQIEFFHTDSILNIFDRKISSLPINAAAIFKEINRLEADLRSLRKKITEATKANNPVVSSLYASVIKYATELEIGDNTSIRAPYLFTSNLKELSGALLHKTVFAFRLAYIIEIEKVLGIKLPIILDSPSGKEVDPTNIHLMVSILKRDFASNQILIASIFHYDFENASIIEMKNRLVE